MANGLLPVFFLRGRGRHWRIFHGNTDILVSLIGEFEVFFNIGVFLDLEEDDWRGNQETTNEETPARSKFRHESGTLCIHAVQDN